MRLSLLAFMFVTIAFSATIKKKSKLGTISTCYECFLDECENKPYNKTCQTTLGCYTATEIVGAQYYHRRGCFTHAFVRLSRCEFKNKNRDLSICCDGNLCNVDEFLSIPDHWSPSIPPNQWTTSLIYEFTPSTTPKTAKKKLKNVMEEIILTQTTHQSYQTAHLPNQIVYFFVLPLVVIVAIACLALIYYEKTNRLKRYDKKDAPDVTFHKFVSSGSGSGVPTLNQRCLAQDVSLIDCIGQGRYGEVWRGVWHGENVAVKIFSSKDEASWKNEVDIYTNIALFHENVLGFKGAVIATRRNATEMWLFTAFHEQGSLYDYLLDNPVTHKQMIEFVRSICSGLLHLHTEIFCAKGKPAIALRDLKTRNILLTPHGTCVIADFGLALVKNYNAPGSDVPVNYRVGTKRYMAPEILDDSINVNSFESFKRADIYAFGLILWEVCWRCITDGKTEAYRPPFEGSVPNNPDFEDVKKVVCIELKRPEIPAGWESNKPLDDMTALMKECWHKNPEIRPTVCRVKKILDKIYAEIQELQSTTQTV